MASCLWKLVCSLFCILPISLYLLPALGYLECSQGVLMHIWYFLYHRAYGIVVKFFYQYTESPLWAVALIFCHGSMKMRNSLTSLFLHILCVFIQNTIQLLSYLVKSLLFFKSSICVSFSRKAFRHIFYQWLFCLFSIIFSVLCYLCSYNILCLFHCSNCYILLYLLLYLAPLFPTQTYNQSDFLWMNDGVKQIIIKYWPSFDLPIWLGFYINLICKKYTNEQFI